MINDTTQLLFTLLIGTLPALIVGAAMFLLVRQYMQRDYKKRLLELRMKNSETVLPIRLQAYERICLFLERITPSNLLLRVSGSGTTAAEYHRTLLTEIRNEYNHNISQQIYMSEQAWQLVKRSREDVVTMINRAYQEMNDKSRGTDLAKKVLETILSEEIDPTARAINFMKREMNQIF